MKLYKEIKNNFSLIEKQFSEENLSEFKNTRLSDLWLYHFGLGTWIRNNLLYPDKKLLYNLFIKNGIEHTDEMSTLIIRLFHYHITHKI